MKGTPAPHFRGRIKESFLASAEGALTLVDYLAQATGHSKSTVKKVLTLGGVWIYRDGAKKRRVRRASLELKDGDKIDYFYKPALLAQDPPTPIAVKERHHYGVWFKPAGLPSEATPFSDRNSLLFAIEQKTKKAHLQGRLDLEVSGLVLASYSKKATEGFAKAPASSWQKLYLARVEGRIDAVGWTDITHPLEGKACLTRFRALFYDEQNDCTLIEIDLLTGRTHQIRQHLSMEGHSILGDRRYGTGGSKGGSDLNLLCYRFILQDPFDLNGKPQTITVPEAYWPDFLVPLKDYVS
jgi:tRNA pseudouridine32 synthase / 23S rRNA pseudouridine746 synthase